MEALRIITEEHQNLWRIATTIDQVADDPLGRPLGDPDPFGEIADPGLRVAGEHDHYVPVIGQEGPVGHAPSLPSQKVGKQKPVLDVVYCSAPWT